ncbi:GNAT family N-acetyltransferase [Microbacteriaceae bacterium 4G12]
MITLHLLTEDIAEELFQFELDNRAFFETMVPSRGDDYYVFENFYDKLTELIQERVEKTAFMYIIRNESGQLIGRINLVNADAETKTAELGYRIGEHFGNQGYATEAVHLIVQEAKQHQLQSVYASTVTDNVRSQTVLTKNQFQLISREKEAVEWNGEKMDFLIFEYRCS